MKNILKFTLFLYFFLLDFTLFAQPTDEDDNGDLEGNDPPAAPINRKLILLFVFGLFYAWSKLKKEKTEKLS